MSHETFVCLQLILSLLFRRVLKENEADRFSSAKIEILTYFPKEYLFGPSLATNIRSHDYFSEQLPVHYK